MTTTSTVNEYVSGVSISGANISGVVTIDPAGTGNVVVIGLEPEVNTGNTGQYYRGDKTFVDFATDVRKFSIENIAEDTTPQLGGDLNASGRTIDMGPNIITNAKVGKWDTAHGWGDHSAANYLTEHPDIDSAVTGTTANTNPNFIQNVELDSNGHVTAVTAVSVTPGSIGAASGNHSHTVDDLPTTTSTGLGSSNELIPTQNAVKVYVDGKVQTDVPPG